jgi:predicted RNA-binding Zn ribbon-like protein
MDEPREAESHRLIGGVLCLDFANTLNGHDRTPHHEYLHDYRDLVLWGRHAGSLSEKEVGVLLIEAARRPAEAEAVYRLGLELRETIFRLFSSLAKGGHADASDLERLGAAWREGQAHASLVPAAGGFRLGWDDEPCLERLLRTVSASAVTLLTSAALPQVRRCAGERCDWLFIDTSRNHLRRWCSMDECGNHAKMRRRRDRQKLARAGSDLQSRPPQASPVSRIPDINQP